MTSDSKTDRRMLLTCRNQLKPYSCSVYELYELHHYSGFPKPLAGFKGPTSKAPTSKSRGKDGRRREERRVEGSPK